jgi:hypothetical protein
MFMVSTNVALMTGADRAWAANQMEHRREAYVSYSPLCWRTAQTAIPLHPRFLERQLARGGFRTAGLGRLGYRLASTIGPGSDRQTTRTQRLTWAA